MSITTNYGKVVVDTNLVPYIREKQVQFVAQNLKPYKLGKIFFDDVAVNQFCQAPSRLLLDSKKAVTVTLNNQSAIVSANDIAFQGTSSSVNTFSAIVDSYSSANSTVLLRRLTGNFDDQAQLYLQNVSSNTIYANCNVVVVANFNTSDSFYPGEGVVAPDKGNVFAVVVATSGENILYIKNNYLNININSADGYAIPSEGSFKDGDIVFQTVDGANRYDLPSFKGVVRYFNLNNQGTIAIEPLFGKVNVNSTSTSACAVVRLWNSSNPGAPPITANSFNRDNFGENSNVQSVINTSVRINTSSWIHRSGVIANTSPPNNATIILNTRSGNDPANGNLIYFVSGTGVGTIRRVISINNDVAVLNSALGFNVSCNTYYSLNNFEVDQYGTLAGIFHIPSFSNYKFKTGNRILTITDTNTYNDPDYQMRAVATYAASGILKSTQRLQTTPTLQPLPEMDADALVSPLTPSDRTFNNPANKSPVTGSTASTTPRIPLGDGLSQTFFTPKALDNNQDYGIFVSSIDLFFKNKPSVAAGNMQLPITVKIAEVVNGYPTKNYLASKTIQTKDVNVSSLPSTSNASTITKFTFDDPVYLEPAREYAIVVGSDSPDYELFISEIGEEVLGASPARRISEQPYAGSLFRSQNSSTWSPYQNQDLMFVINKAVFQTSGTATFNLEVTPTANVDIDRVMLISSDLKFPVASVDYRLRGLYSSNSQQETLGVYVVPYAPIEYGALLDRSGKPASGSFLNRRRLVRGNANSFLMTLEMSSRNADVSPIVNLERLSLAAATFGINNAGLQNTNISITNSGAGYNAHISSGNDAIKGVSNSSLNNFATLYRQTYLANNYNVGFYSITITNSPNDSGTGATGFAVANTDGTNTVSHIVITTTGSGYLETPTISFATGNATSNTQAQGIVSGETSKSGGNMIAKYITREIVLEDGFESGDLRVFMDAIRPTATDVQVYYKVLSPDDPERLVDKSWRRMEIVKDIYSKDPRTIIGLEFRPSLTENKISYVENGLNYPIGGFFKNFAIKVCLRTTDASIVPKVRNLRISALPEG
jgi:hypothetical protein